MDHVHVCHCLVPRILFGKQVTRTSCDSQPLVSSTDKTRVSLRDKNLVLRFSGCLSYAIDMADSSLDD